MGEEVDHEIEQLEQGWNVKPVVKPVETPYDFTDGEVWPNPIIYQLQAGMDARRALEATIKAQTWEILQPPVQRVEENLTHGKVETARRGGQT